MKKMKVLSVIVSLGFLVGCSGGEVESTASTDTNSVEPTNSNEAIIEPSVSSTQTYIDYANMTEEQKIVSRNWVNFDQIVPNDESELGAYTQAQFCIEASRILGIDLETVKAWSGDQPEIPQTHIWGRTSADKYHLDRYYPVIPFNNNFFAKPGCFAQSPAGAVFNVYTSYFATSSYQPLGYSIREYDWVNKTAVVGLIETTTDAFTYNDETINPNITLSIEFDLFYNGYRWEITKERIVNKNGVSFYDFVFWKPKADDTFINADVYLASKPDEKADREFSDWVNKTLTNKEYTFYEIGGMYGNTEIWTNLVNLQKKLNDPNYEPEPINPIPDGYDS